MRFDRTPSLAHVQEYAECQHRQHRSLLSAETRPIPRHFQNQLPHWSHVTGQVRQCRVLRQCPGISAYDEACVFASPSHPTSLYTLFLPRPLFASLESYTVTCTLLSHSFPLTPRVYKKDCAHHPTTCLSHEHTDRSSARSPRLRAHRALPPPST
jgi:hypothetical protein